MSLTFPPGHPLSLVYKRDQWTIASIGGILVFDRLDTAIYADKHNPATDKCWILVIADIIEDKITLERKNHEGNILRWEMSRSEFDENFSLIYPD